MRRSLFLIFLALGVEATAQYEPLAKNAFLNEHVQTAFEFWNISQPNLKFHAAFRPYLSSTYSDAKDSVLPFKAYPFNNFFLSKILNEDPRHRNWFQLQFQPIVEFEPGYDMLEKRVLTSASGGGHVKFNINNDFTFAATLVGGNYNYPFFMDTTIGKSFVIPEHGIAYKGTQAGYHFFDYTGYVSYTPQHNKYFNLQAGRDKHFIGNGYRSLLPSDLAPAYPFVRINTNVWRLQYNIWYAWMNDPTTANGFKSQFRNKYGVFHYLSINASKFVNIGLFENVIWRGTDTNQVRNFDVNYLNPVVFFRPVEYSIGSPDNSFLGINLSFILFRHLRVYGQLALDEFYLKEIRAHRGWWANKQGWQAGFRYINVFGVKGLYTQMEYNQVRPYTYTHGLPDQNYGHYGYALAHPMGANFKEFVANVGLRRGNTEFAASGVLAFSGKDSLNGNTNVGQNIFLSYVTRDKEYDNHTGQGVPCRLAQGQLKYTWFAVPAMNLRVEVGYIQRAESAGTRYRLQNPYFFFGLKSSIWNTYRDF